MAVTSARSKFKAWNIQHYRRLAKYDARLEALLNQAIANAAGIVGRRGVSASDKPFSFSDDRQMKAEADKIMKDLSADITALTRSAESAEWKQAYEQATGYIGELYRVAFQTKYLQDKYADMMLSMRSRNLDALHAFQQRKIGGMGLSSKVWDYTEDFKSQMEVAIDTALMSGQSADTLALSIQDLLKNPDALFRRVRDENDELRMSKAMAAYHPGAGRYRSAYKNAMRLARSEINMAYRASDSQTAQDLDCVVGIRVNLSNNHTCNGKPFYDICDELSNQNYPKDFYYVGWHPQCRCYITYILKTDEEFWEDLEAGENNESVNTVNDVPDAFKEWVGKNEERIARASERGTLPYFLRDNQQYYSIATQYIMTSADYEYLVNDNNFQFINYTGKPDIEAYNDSPLRGFNMHEFYDELSQIWGDEGYSIYDHNINLLNDSAATIQFEAVNADGKKIVMYRTFTRKGDKTDIHHDIFSIPKESQGSGISKKTFSALFKQYDQMGHVNSVNLLANLNIGGYAWSRYGFATTEEGVDGIFTQYLERKKKLQKLTSDDLNVLRNKFNEIIKEKSFVRDGVTYIDMRDLSEVPNAKELFLGSEWEGFLFFDNPKQLRECHNYFKP